MTAITTQVHSPLYQTDDSIETIVFATTVALLLLELSLLRDDKSQFRNSSLGRPFVVVAAPAPVVRVGRPTIPPRHSPANTILPV